MQSFTEFTTENCISCTHCSISSLTKDYTSFCYEIYKKNWSNFYSHSFPLLKKHDVWPFSIEREEALFEKTFCDSGTCGKKSGSRCKNFNWCLNIFTSQMMGRDRFIRYHETNLKRIVEGPTLIIGGSKKWKKMVNSMG